MKTEFSMFDAADGARLPAYIYLPDGEVKSVLQLTHGMTEHMGRYKTTAEILTEKGIALAGFDLRGHGKNEGSRTCASFGEGGWDRTLQDMHIFHEILCRRFVDIPQAMLGFSLGSFLLRDYLNSFDDKLWKAVIMGSGWQPGFVLTVLKKTVQGQINKFGFDNSSSLVNKLSLEAYNGKFRPNRTASDWLCSDEKELVAYIEDPLCRNEISGGLFWQMLDSMQRTGSSTAYNNWDKNMPVLLLSGADDPVGDMGRGVRKLKSEMEKAGVKSVSLQLLTSARHDVLHEEKSGAREKAIKLILEFLNN